MRRAGAAIGGAALGVAVFLVGVVVCSALMGIADLLITEVSR